MRANKLFKRPKAKNGEGRSSKIKHILLPEEVAEDLKLFRDCYTDCLGVKVSYEQMLRRWFGQVSRIDPDIAKMFDQKKARKEELAHQAAGLGLTPEQFEANKAAYDPTNPEDEPWKLRYFFEKDGEQVDALPGVYTPFYAQINGCNIGMRNMLANGWALINEVGIELDYTEAVRIQSLKQST